MKIESKDFKIKNIFSQKTYIIPDYQRNYSWTEVEEISQFWEDFLYYLEEDDGANFFIGAMVFKANNINSSEFEVIDGQQRLVTFSILISVVVAMFTKYHEFDLAEGLKKYLVYTDEKNKKKLVIDIVEPHPFFQKKIFHSEDVKPHKQSEKLIEKARAFFEFSIETQLKSKTKKNRIEYLEKIRDFLFNIDTVIIVSDSDTDAFTIFETINTRGKDLSSIDLLKNYIFKHYLNKVGVNEPKETWKKIADNIKSDNGNFFNRFWASWVLKVSENKLYRRFHDNMRDKLDFSNANILLEELYIASDVYKRVSNPKLDDWKINKDFEIYFFLKNINGLFNLRVHYPFLLALIEEFQNKRVSKELLKRALLIMENFHFIFTHIVSARASGLDNKYSKFAIRLRKEKDKSKVINELINDLIEKLPEEKEFLEKFKKLNFIKHKDTIKFVLLKIEKQFNKSIFIDLEHNSIEHLDPKSTKNSEVQSIGNLFLLEKEINNIKDDCKPFDRIKTAKSPLAISYLKNETKYNSTKKELEKIEKQGKWSEKEINDRTLSLGKYMYAITSKLI